MKIFLSHSSKQKPLIREIKSYLPNHIKTWLDENEIIIGDSIEKSLKNAIQSETDFIVLFIDDYAVNSKWINSEIIWALNEEKRTNRIIILPIVIDIKAWEMVKFPDLKNRKFLKCYNYEEVAIRNIANELIAELFAILSREIEKSKQTKQYSNIKAFKLLNEADTFLSDVAQKVRNIVFGYRLNNPLPVSELKTKLNSVDLISSLSLDQFSDLLIRLANQGYLSGIVFNGETIYIAEEHFSWKTRMFSEYKKKIANKSISYIKNGDFIALDSGSSTLEIANSIAKAIKLQILSNIKIATNSIAAAKVLIDTLSELGLDEHNNILQIYLTGGHIRPNTLALIDIPNNSNYYSFENLFNNLQKPDIGFVGVNGVHPEFGFSTHINMETQIKKDIIKHAKKVFLLADESKFGIKEEIAFCTFDNYLTLIANKSDVTIDYKRFFINRNTKLILC